jgi:hypothetical protein
MVSAQDAAMSAPNGLGMWRDLRGLMGGLF